MTPEELEAMKARNRAQQRRLGEMIAIKYNPWHPKNCPERLPPEELEDWSRRTKEWCRSRDVDRIRRHLCCPRCGFRFVWRTSNYSMRTSADVDNYGRCCNADCKHSWTERS